MIKGECVLTWITEGENTDFNLFGIPVQLIPTLKKQLDKELFTRGNMLNYSTERAQFAQNTNKDLTGKPFTNEEWLAKQLKLSI